MKQIKTALTRFWQLLPLAPAASLKHFSRMRNTRHATALFIVSCCLLAADTAVAADTGRRCCAFVMHTPVGKNMRSTGATYLESRNQIVAVDADGYIGFINNPTDTFCAEFSQSIPNLHTYEFRPWGERHFQGVTTWGTHEDSVLILEIPTEYYCDQDPPDGAWGIPVLHNLNLSTLEITWSEEVTEGPYDDFGGGITWIPDGSAEGIFFISLKSERQIAKYRVAADGTTIEHLGIITLPISSDSNYIAYNLKALAYNERSNGIRELWALFGSRPATDTSDPDYNPKADDMLYAYQLGGDGTIIGTEPLGDMGVDAERGHPQCPAGLVVINHPDPSSSVARVFLAAGDRYVYELWYKRYKNRFTRCPWYYKNLYACYAPQEICCLEMTKNDCTNAGGTYDPNNWKRWGDPRPLCGDDLTITGPIVFTGQQTRLSNGSLATSGAVTVASGAQVSFEAGTRIRLTPGFQVSAGGQFTAAIDVAGCPLVVP